MNNKQSYIPNAVTKTLICADEKTESDFSGVLYNPYMPEPVSITQTKDILDTMENFFNEIEYPQSYFQDRSFPDKAATEYKPPKAVERYQDESILTHRRGKLATFEMTVRYRQSATWQGSFRWIEGDESREFRSAMELIMFMDQAIFQGRIAPVG